MKRLLSLALAFASSLAIAATLNPVQLLNPVGSTTGQAVVSTGPTTPPAWGAVALSGITGTLAIANGGTGATSAAAARTALGAASTSANTFSGNQSVQGINAAFSVNDTSGGQSRYNFDTAGTIVWGLVNNSATGQLNLNRYGSGILVDVPLSWSNSTGASTFSIRPIFGTATPYDSANLSTSAQLATAISDETGTGSVVFGTSPTITTPNIVGGTVAAGSGFVGQVLTNSTTGTPLTTNTPVNATSLTLPAGVWDVQGVCSFVPAGTTVTSYAQCGLGTTSAGFPAPPAFAGIGQGPNGVSLGVTVMTTQFILTTSTVIYLTAISGFTVSTDTVRGDIRAIRTH